MFLLNKEGGTIEVMMGKVRRIPMVRRIFG